MIRLSSNATIFYKIFIPVFFTVFYGLFTIFIWRNPSSMMDDFKWFPLSNTLFYLAVVFILYKSLWQLKRIEAGKDHIIITDYRKAYQYSWDSVDSMIVTNYLLLKVVHFFFKEETSFGRNIPFIYDLKGFKELKEKYPDIHLSLLESNVD